MQPHTTQFLRTRKFLLALPILAVPLLTMLVWSLGIGRNQATPSTNSNGLNTQLPSPDMEGAQAGDKLSLYQKAEKDSLERARILGNDSLVDRSVTGGMAMPIYEDDISRPAAAQPSRPTFAGSGGIQHTEDPNEAMVRQRLDALNRELNKATTPQPPAIPPPTQDLQAQQSMAQLEAMLQQQQTLPIGEADPQMSQIKDVLERIMDVQHPELVKERLQAASAKNKSQVFLIQTQKDPNVCEILAPMPPIRALQRRPQDTSGPRVNDTTALPPPAVVPVISDQRTNRFFEVDATTNTTPAGNAATAVVHGTQEMLPGATLKMRLTQDIYIQGVLIPAGTPVHGEGNLNGERLIVSVTAIRYGDGRYPVSLSVYDYDGLPGIRIRDAISRQTSAQGADRALQSMQLYSMDPSLGAQAASAGMETAKMLFSKKIKLQKATVKADYPVLLVDNNNQ